MTDSPIIKAQVELYRRSVLEHGDSPRATFNVQRDLQWLRFERLVEPLLALSPSFSIHDVGAGLCDLHAYLLERGIEHEYSATEIVPEMIELAQRKYPGLVVQRRDLLAGAVPDRHDFVVANGVFNLPGAVPPEDWRRFVFAMLERMFEMATQAISVNFLTSHRTFSDPALFYLDPGALLQYCQTRLSRFVRIDHAYPLFEYTALVRRHERVEAEHPDESYRKYFRHRHPTRPAP